jgi:hypothetical protein
MRRLLAIISNFFTVYKLFLETGREFRNATRTLSYTQLGRYNRQGRPTGQTG